MKKKIQNFLKKQKIKFLCFSFLVTAYVVHNNIPEGFGRTHFIQGLNQYPLLISRPTKTQKNSHNYPKTACTVLFSPNKVVLDTLCELITNEQSQIYIAVYTLTDKRIAKELVQAKKRGVHIEIITDRGSPLDRSTKIGFLHTNNIPIFLYQPPLEKDVQKGLMHNKFALFFDNGINHEKIVWHGSFNFSYSGYRHNCESILILREPTIFHEFETEFRQIKQRSTRYQPQGAT